jgi:bifunctional UDP-N-acetylglucosamine pyrophosphorylase/glucosamine-1-phosphate N-acetyltransferase
MTPTMPTLHAIILAAGKGTRMNSDLPKVLHTVGDRPMIDWVMDAVDQAGVQHSVIIVGHQADQVRAALADRENCQFAMQDPQLGTAHAVMQAEPFFAEVDETTDVLVLCGDGPLIRTDTLAKLVDTHRKSPVAATLATAVLENPDGYGRIIRSREGRFLRIVEQKDATPSEEQIREVNPSYYCFKALPLFEALKQVDNDNAKGEYYITDVFEILRRNGHAVNVVEAVPAEDVLSINTPEELTRVDMIIRQRAMNG